MGIIFYIVGIVMLLVVAKIMLLPLRRVFDLLVNTVLGGLMLMVVNFFGSMININILLTPLNAILVGFLGVPGVIVLIALELLRR